MDYSISIFLTMNFAIAMACDYSSFGYDHTMCKYTGQACNFIRRGFSGAEKANIVRYHNEKRQQVATGNQNGQPSASNMIELVWDDELETIAQRWADQCSFGHDSNRRSKRYGYAGQNVHMASTTGSDDSLDIQSAINGLYNEVSKFDPNSINPFRFNYAAGHYTQIVWADTKAVGCGYSSWKDGRWTNKYMVCNYGPGGNMIGSTMYRVGKACSTCSNGCSTAYPGLCRQ